MNWGSMLFWIIAGSWLQTWITAFVPIHNNNCFGLSVLGNHSQNGPKKKVSMCWELTPVSIFVWTLCSFSLEMCVSVELVARALRWHCLFSPLHQSVMGVLESCLVQSGRLCLGSLVEKEWENTVVFTVIKMLFIGSKCSSWILNIKHGWGALVFRGAKNCFSISAFNNYENKVIDVKWLLCCCRIPSSTPSFPSQR